MVAHAAMVDAYVAQLLDRQFGAEVVALDRGYQVPLPGQPRVEVVGGQSSVLRVRVSAALLTDVTTTPALLDLANRVNTDLPFGRVVITDGNVLVEHLLLGRTLDPPGLDNAVHFVSWVVQSYRQDLAAAAGALPTRSAPSADEDPDAEAAPGPDLPRTDASVAAAATSAAAGHTVGRRAGRSAGHPAVGNAAGYL